MDKDHVDTTIIFREIFKILDCALGYESENWKEIVSLVNKIENDEDKKTALMMPENERTIDDLGLKCAWMYERLGNKKRANAIKKALGY